MQCLPRWTLLEALYSPDNSMLYLKYIISVRIRVICCQGHNLNWLKQKEDHTGSYKWKTKVILDLKITRARNSENVVKISITLCKSQLIFSFCPKSVAAFVVAGGSRTTCTQLIWQKRKKTKTKTKTTPLFFSPFTKHFRICSDWSNMDYMSILETICVFL